jgi:DNA-binding CsgD family transcriptional regulator
MQHIAQTQSIGFTTRENEVLRYIAEGFSSRQIAATLFISENTVANHRRNMIRKNGAKSIARLISSILNYYAA